MSADDKIVLGMLVAIWARTFVPPLGPDSVLNRAGVAIVSVGATLFVGYVVGYWVSR